MPAALAASLRRREIPGVIGVLVPAGVHPSPLAVHTLPFRSLAALAGRAPLGGEREIALGCYMAARLVAGALGPDAPPSAAREARAASARSWFAGLAVPATTRLPFARLADASAGSDRCALAEALTTVIRVTEDHLDAESRAELEGLLERLAE